MCTIDHDPASCACISSLRSYSCTYRSYIRVQYRSSLSVFLLQQIKRRSSSSNSLSLHCIDLRYRIAAPAPAALRSSSLSLLTCFQGSTVYRSRLPLQYQYCYVVLTPFGDVAPLPYAKKVSRWTRPTRQSLEMARMGGL